MCAVWLLHYYSIISYTQNTPIIKVHWEKESRRCERSSVGHWSETHQSFFHFKTGKKVALDWQIASLYFPSDPLSTEICLEHRRAVQIKYMYYSIKGNVFGRKLIWNFFPNFNLKLIREKNLFSFVCVQFSKRWCANWRKITSMKNHHFFLKKKEWNQIFCGKDSFKDVVQYSMIWSTYTEWIGTETLLLTSITHLTCSGPPSIWNAFLANSDNSSMTMLQSLMPIKSL